MPPLRFVWLVERGWIADEVHRRLLAQLSPAAFDRRDGRCSKEIAEMALDSYSGPAWIVPETHQVSPVVQVARPLFEAQSRLPRAKDLGATPVLVGILGEVYLYYEELWDRAFLERLESEAIADMARKGLHLVRSRKKELPQRHRALIEAMERQYIHVLAQVGKDTESVDLRLGVSRSLFDVARPFSDRVLGVSSLADLRSLLPPFTEELSPDDWKLFRAEQELLRERTDALSRPASFDVASSVANRLMAEFSIGVTQVTTEFDWQLQRTVATSRSPVRETVHLFEDLAGSPARWSTPSQVRIIGGLLGLAYFDVFAPKSTHCPDCGSPTSPGQRGPRNVLCSRCGWVRRQKSQAAKRSSYRSQSRQLH